MMAGMAMTSLLKTKGLLATVMAWAAFCMPISMTMVRCSLPDSLMSHDMSTPLPMDSRMSTVTHRPKAGNSRTMVSRCCTKKTVANRMRQGKANRFSTL